MWIEASRTPPEPPPEPLVSGLVREDACTVLTVPAPGRSSRGQAGRDQRDQGGRRQPRGADHQVPDLPARRVSRYEEGGPVAGRGITAWREPGPVMADGDLPGAARNVRVSSSRAGRRRH